MNIVLYSRVGCTCCDRALAVLRPRLAGRTSSLEIIDIDTDPDLKARYGTSVPVVLIDGVERFRGQINPVLLDRLLARRAHESC